MTWPTIIIIFVSLFTLFNNINYNPQTNCNPQEFQMRQTEYDQYLPYDTSYQIVSANLYQTIVSYVMNYNKNLVLTDVLEIAEANVKYGIEYNVDPLLLTAQQSAESSFNRHAVSPSGARGIGQFMPFNFPAYNITDPHNVAQGIKAQAKMMRELLDMWKGNINYALASYVEGCNSIKSKGSQAFKPSTQGYVDKILKTYENLKKLT
ncbi:MAG: lytic transglycosylase domain-containing protein [Candidatus Margulisbacteria bacterium]|nr:lytic transglycosylase domain-containing protein [Candidatus Margulisiibacteriota bacterium]